MICDYFVVSSCMQSEESPADEYGSEEFFKYAGAIEEATKRQSEADAQFREMLLKLDVSYDAWNWSDGMRLLMVRLTRLESKVLKNAQKFHVETIGISVYTCSARRQT